MKETEDFTGRRYGLLTVIERTTSTPNRASRWICKCDCGNTTIAVSTKLKDGARVSCGCKKRGQGRALGALVKPKNDLSNNVYGLLTVLEWGKCPDTKMAQWLCSCRCGNFTYARSSDLRLGRRLSCGCANGKTHGLSKTSEYRTWAGMIHRCTNPKVNQYKDYGGRGITVCARWKESVENFVEDMGERPSKRLTLDRINNNDGYHCGKCEECKRNGWVANCRWATWEQQAGNRRKPQRAKG